MVSSVNKNEENSLCALCSSFIRNKNTREPKIDPWGTQILVFLIDK